MFPVTRLPFARLAVVGAVAAAASGVGCGHTAQIPGTTVVDTRENREILEVVDKYRQRLLEKNVEGLLLLAAENYFEDGGTPDPRDDYGYDGLRERLVRTLARVKSLRYEIKYRNVRRDGSKAEVEVFLSGAFELQAESGPRYRPVSSYHRFVLELNKDRWKFVSGM